MPRSVQVEEFLSSCTSIALLIAGQGMSLWLFLDAGIAEEERADITPISVISRENYATRSDLANLFPQRLSSQRSCPTLVMEVIVSMTSMSSVSDRPQRSAA